MGVLDQDQDQIINSMTDYNKNRVKAHLFEF